MTIRIYIRSKCGQIQMVESCVKISHLLDLSRKRNHTSPDDDRKRLPNANSSQLDV